MSNQVIFKKDQDHHGNDWEKLFEALASIFSVIHSLHKSQNLIEDVNFWKWLQKANRKGFANSSSIHSLAVISPEYLKNTLRSKGMEYDWFCEYNNDLFNISGVAELAESPIDPVGDAYIEDIFTGERQPVQMKTTKRIPNDPSRTMRNANRHLSAIPGKYPKGTRIVGNQPVVDAVKGSRSYNLKAYLIERGWTDKEEAKFITSKYEKARKGKAAPNLTAKVVVSNIGKAALVGALLFVLIEVVKDWREWEKGEITGKEFLLRILKQGGKGALLGGGIGVISLLLFSLT